MVAGTRSRRVGLAAAAVLLLAAAPASAENQTPGFTTPVTDVALPYALALGVDDFGATALPTLQSYAAGQADGEWVLIGGRTNGLHDFTNSGLVNFPPAAQNHTIWVIDPVTKQSWSRSLDGSGLTTAEIDALSATNYETLQSGGRLYMVGGYGYDTTDAAFKTYDGLTSVDLEGLISWVKGAPDAPPIDSIFRTIHDPALQVTGGELSEVDGRAMLVFGQNFTGGYTPGSNGDYTSQVRSFTIVDNGTALAITDLGASPDPGDPSQFRRRDYNLLDVVRRDPLTGQLSDGLVALAGVFTESGGGWTVPVEIGADGVPVQADPSAPATFKQALNVYSSAKVGSFSETTGANYDTLFGGISAGTWDSGTGTFTPDPNLPFDSTITTIVIDRNGQYTQVVMAAAFPTLLSQTNSEPLLFGAEAHFFLADGIPTFDNGVIDLDQLMATATSDQLVLGWVYGGIEADAPNFGHSAASNNAFTVTIDLPPFIDLDSPGVVEAGVGTLVRRLLVENPGAVYRIGAGDDLTAFGGGTVASGGLVVDGLLLAHALDIQAAGWLKGTGVIQAPTSVEGRLEPGDSPGTLTFTEPLALGAGSSLAIDIDGPGTGSGAGSYSRILAAGPLGSITLGGSFEPILRGIAGNATNSFTPALGQGFTVIAADAGISGSFAGLVQPADGLPPGTRFDLLYRSDAVELYVTPARYGQLGAAGIDQTANQGAVGAALDRLRPPAGTLAQGGTKLLFDSLDPLGAGGITSALDQLSGQVYADAAMASAANRRAFATALGDHLAGLGATPAGAQQAEAVGLLQLAMGGSSIADAGMPAAAADGGGLGSHLWARGFGNFDTVSGDGNAAGASSRTGGLLVGAETPITDQLLLGAALGYAHSDLDADRNLGSASINSYQALAYASYRSGPALVTGSLGYAFNQYDVDRPIDFAGRTAHGSTNGNDVSAGLAAGWRFELGALSLVPEAGLRYDRIEVDSLNESGAGIFDLAIDQQVENMLRSSLGGRVAWHLAPDEAHPLVAEFRARWDHDFLDRSGRIDADLGGASFSVDSSKVGRNAAVLGVGLAGTVADGVQLYGGYQIELRANETTNYVAAGFRLRL
ncbi:MAG: autotransporter domain-containing protein [Dongiaceae bacterium]